MAETEIEGLETEVQSGGCRCRRQLKKLLKRLADKCKKIAVIIKSGENCCRQVGCIADVDDCFLVLIDQNNVCKRTYIPLDCICAVKDFVPRDKKGPKC